MEAKKRALIAYHFQNGLNVAFLTYIMLRIFNIGNFRMLIHGQSQIIFFLFIGTIIILGMYARGQVNGMKNPMLTHKYAKYLHYTGIGLFLITVLLLVRVDNQLIFVGFFALPLDLAAFILTLRDNKMADLEENELIDDIDFEE